MLVRLSVDFKQLASKIKEGFVMVFGEDLQAILSQSKRDRADWLDEDPTACPNDGTPLQTGPNGELHCPFDGWIWDGNPRSKA